MAPFIILIQQHTVGNLMKYAHLIQYHPYFNPIHYVQTTISPPTMIFSGIGLIFFAEKHGHSLEHLNKPCIIDCVLFWPYDCLG